jgi:hypothetical protein
MDTSEPCYSIETLVEALYRGVLSRASDEKVFGVMLKVLHYVEGKQRILHHLSKISCPAKNAKTRQLGNLLGDCSLLRLCKIVNLSTS